MTAVTCSITCYFSDLEHLMIGQELRLTNHMTQQLGSKKASFVVEIKMSREASTVAQNAKPL